jgi:hypothetical protein
MRIKAESPILGATLAGVKPDEERARGFGVEGDDAGSVERGFDESKTLAYRLARGAVTSVLPGGELLATLIDHEQQRQVRIARDLVDNVVEVTSADELLRRVSESEEVAAAFRQAIDVATRTGLEQKRRALARIVAAAVLDDARVDAATLFVLALRDLDAPHLRALERMRRAEDSVERQDGVTRLNDAEVTKAVRQVSEVEPDAVNSALVRAGVAHIVGSSWGGQPVPGMISDFGRDLLHYLHESRE